jgi:hypothetical protein
MCINPTIRHTSPIIRSDDIIFHGCKERERQANDSIESTARKCRSLQLQRLQTSWGWTTVRKVSQFHLGREGFSRYHQGGFLRMSGRMWLWTKPCNRWQDQKLCKRTRCSNQSIGDRRRRTRKLNSFFNFNNNNRTLFRIREYFLILLLLNYLSSSTMIITVNGFCSNHFSVGSSSRVSGYGYGYGYGSDYRGLELKRRKTMFREEYDGGRIMLSTMWMTNDNGDNIDCNTGDDGGDGHDHDHDNNEHEHEHEHEHEKQMDIEIGEADEISAIPDLSWRVEKLRLEEANTRRFLKSKPRFLPYDECRKWVQAWNRWDSEAEWVSWIAEGEKRNSYIPSRPDEYYSKLGKWKGWAHFLGKDGNE